MTTYLPSEAEQERLRITRSGDLSEQAMRSARRR